MSSWQDLVIGAAQIVFVASLVPAWWSSGGRAIPLWTSLPTTLALCAIGAAVWTLGLWVSAVTSLLCAYLWSGLVKQRLEVRNAD